jgi:hypothetical protein
VVKALSPWNYAPPQALQKSWGRKEGLMRRARCWDQFAVGLMRDSKRPTSGVHAAFKAPCTDFHPLGWARSSGGMPCDVWAGRGSPRGLWGFTMRIECHCWEEQCFKILRLSGMKITTNACSSLLSDCIVWVTFHLSSFSVNGMACSSVCLRQGCTTGYSWRTASPFSSVGGTRD